MHFAKTSSCSRTLVGGPRWRSDRGGGRDKSMSGILVARDNIKYLQIQPPEIHQLHLKSNVLRKDLLQMFEKSEFTEVYFVNDNGVLLGKTKVNALLQKKNTTLIEDRSPLTLNINLDVSDAIVKVSNFVGESIPVVDHDGKLVGVLNEADLFLQYLKVQDAISHIEKD